MFNSTDFKNRKMETKLSITTHIQQLKIKHLELSQQIEAAQRIPFTDQFRIIDMKKRKLRLKETIVRLININKIAKIDQSSRI